MPRSAAFSVAITACRSSRFLPLTRTASPWVWLETPFGRLLLDQLVDLAGLVAGDADLDRGDLAHGVLRGLLDLAVVEALERDAALDELLLEHLTQRGRRSSLTVRRVNARSFCSIDELVFLKSKRVLISRCAWSTALRTSWRSTSETTSKLGMTARVPVDRCR